jgi:hypothetical protein
MAGIHPRYERLLEAGLALAAELSLPAALQRIVELAAELTGARYGALGVLIDDASPPRLHDIAEDSRSVGFPTQPSADALLPRSSSHGTWPGLRQPVPDRERGGEDFDAEDERALILLAAQARVAIENAQLYEETRDRARRLEAIGPSPPPSWPGPRACWLWSSGTLGSWPVPTCGYRGPARGSVQLAVEAADGLLAEQLQGTVFPARAR